LGSHPCRIVPSPTTSSIVASIGRYGRWPGNSSGSSLDPCASCARTSSVSISRHRPSRRNAIFSNSNSDCYSTLFFFAIIGVIHRLCCCRCCSCS
jgi:hypothetical protein